jgi:hypothetical protein
MINAGTRDEPHLNAPLILDSRRAAYHGRVAVDWGRILFNSDVQDAESGQGGSRQGAA